MEQSVADQVGEWLNGIADPQMNKMHRSFRGEAFLATGRFESSLWAQLSPLRRELSGQLWEYSWLSDE